MYENNNEPAVTEVPETLQSLRDRVTELDSVLTNTKGRLNLVSVNHDRVRRELDSLRSFLVREIENGSIDDESVIDELVTRHGVEVFETKSVSLTFEVTVDVKVARGTEIERYDFEIDGVTYQGDTVDVSTQETTSIDIED